MLKKYFITGTGTDVGKTLTSAALMLALQGSYWKPIQSGASDRACVQQLTGLSDTHFFPANYSFKASLSPDQAARLENITIDLESCVLPTSDKNLIVEGAGGVFVPLNDHACMLDLMKKMNLPIVIVSRGTLGTINHTLLTIEVLRQHGLTLHGVVFSGELNPDNQKSIEKWGKIRTLLHIPVLDEVSPLNLQSWVQSHKQAILENFA